MNVSVVVPVFGSTDNLEELHARLTAALQPACESYELLFVDDCGPDGSADALDAIAATDARIRVLRLKQNQGQHRAALIGAYHAHGDGIVFMDADLQDSPESVVRLVEPLGRGYAAVLARRGPSSAPWQRRMASRLFKGVVHALIGIPADVGMFMAISREMRDALVGYRTRHVYLEGMVALSRLSVATVTVPRAGRPRGGSAYTTVKRIRFAASTLRCLFDCAVVKSGRLTIGELYEEPVARVSGGLVRARATADTTTSDRRRGA
jgi:glycosyltransferase involved in cell wall biosynthesis